MQTACARAYSGHNVIAIRSCPPLLTRRHFIATFAAATVASPAFARPGAVFTNAGYAINGYDPVAYFRKTLPVAGDSAYQLMWHRAIWCFETRANVAAFERNPHAYAPKYGGYCAMSMAKGALVNSVPEAWVIHDDALYLIESTAARDQWLSDPDARIAQANAHWSRLIFN